MLQHSDRNTGCMDAADMAFKRFTHLANLRPLHTQPDLVRPRTYSQKTADNGIHTSRIDDILTLCPLANSLAQTSPQGITETVLDVGGKLDHRTLIHDIVHTAWRLRPTQATYKEPIPSAPRLNLPVSKAHKEEATIQLAAVHGVQAAHLRETIMGEMSVVVSMLERDHTGPSIQRANATRNTDDQGMIDGHAEQLQALSLEMLETMMQVCTTTTQQTGQIYLGRRGKREHCAAYKANKQMKALLRLCKEARLTGDMYTFQASVMEQATLPENEGGPTHDFLQCMPPSTADPTQWDAWMGDLATAVTETGQTFNSMKKDDSLRRDNKRRTTFQAKLARFPRKGHRAIFETNTGEKGGPHAIRSPATAWLHTTGKKCWPPSTHNSPSS